MHLAELRIRGLRNLDELTLEFAPGLNLLLGPNGAGKTSILEAAHLLSHGESFRTHRLDHVQRRGAGELTLFARIDRAGTSHRLGLSRGEERWLARVDGDTPTALIDLFVVCAVICFEPGSHVLISGAAEERRRFLDWGVFHVEHASAMSLRRYRRALRQRNALLKQQASDQELDVWDRELSEAAKPLAQSRGIYVDRLRAFLQPLLERYLPELGASSFAYRAGWECDRELEVVLRQTRQRDRALGHTGRGPHRADWRIAFELAPHHEQLSRGQEKLCAMACLLAQAQLYRESRGEWPIIALDDLCSELDAPHQAAALSAAFDSDAQILLTGTEIPASLQERFPPRRVFHVEQGKLRAVL